VPLFGTATTDDAFTLEPRKGQTYGVYRLRESAERDKRLLVVDWPIVPMKFAGRCDDEWYETTESEWQK